MLPTRTDPDLREARHQLIEHGEVPAESVIGTTVARSWRRCLDHGLTPRGRLADVPYLDAFQFARAAARQQELIANARPVMEYLYGQTRNSGSMVILGDDRGVILHTLGDADFLSRAERVALSSGASWNESQRGTNAIGTALAEAAPVAVHGGEHFLERNGFLTCAAAPVTGPDGRMLGVLDISGDYRGRHPHTFCLVRAAAQMIENRLFEARHGDARRLRFHPLAEGIGTVAEGVVALSGDGWIVGANQAGMNLLGLLPGDLGATSVESLLQLRTADLDEWSQRRSGEILPVMRQHGGRLFMRIEPGRSSGKLYTPARVTQKKKDALSALDTGDARFGAVIAKARRVLGKPIALLLLGESGVGKDVLAKAFRDAGPRRNRPFITLNCATLPESLIEAELFGYAPGAFSGARKQGNSGLIRAAHGGTLFLDEIGDMPPAQQARLLRVLQEREVVPVGGGAPVAVDFDLICATHRNLRQDMEAGRFREDLYYRINGLSLILPPLRERGDLAALTALLLERFAPGDNIGVDPAVTSAFADYGWPGNIRQLANALRTACAMLAPDETTIGWQHLPDDLVAELQSVVGLARSREQRRQLTETTVNLRELSAAALKTAILECRGNMSEAARRLGISRNTLYRRMRREAEPDN